MAQQTSNTPVDSFQINPADPLFLVVEEPATFRGGDIISFRNYIKNNMQIPPELSDVCATGRVIVQFAVNKYGKVVNIKVIRGVHPAIDDLVVKTINLSNKNNTWKPARQGKQVVSQMYTIPVSFNM